MATNAFLGFGAVPMLKPGTPPATPYLVRALGPGLSWGNLDAVIASVASQMMDGDKAKITRFGNRVVTIPVQIEGDTLDTVAAGEVALMAEVNKGRNALTWKPPGTSTPGVYDVVFSELQHNFDDLDEVRVVRQFTLTLTCLPGVRRELMTVTVATPVPLTPPNITVVDACTATTGWTSNWTLSVAGGGLLATRSTYDDYVLFQRAVAPMAFAAGDYLLLEVSTNRTGLDLNNIAVTATTTGPTRSLVLVASDPFIGEHAKLYFSGLGGRTLTGLTITVDSSTIAPADFALYEVSKIDAMPGSGSTRQRSFTVPAGGTMRTEVDLVLESAGASLGDEVLVYTADSGTLAPPLRKYLGSSGAVSTVSPGAGALISGAWQDLSGTPSVYPIPYQQITPGTYLLAARMISSGSVVRTVNWTASTAQDLASSATDVSGSQSVALTVDGKFYQLGVLSLPLVALGAGSDAVLNLTLSATGGAGAGLDELYLFNLDTGELTWLSGLKVGVKMPSKVLLQNATLDSDGLPRWMVGTKTTTVKDISVVDRAVSLGRHSFEPGVVASVFVATPASTQQTVTASAYERFAHNVPAAA